MNDIVLRGLINRETRIIDRKGKYEECSAEEFILRARGGIMRLIKVVERITDLKNRRGKNTWLGIYWARRWGNTCENS